MESQCHDDNRETCGSIQVGGVVLCRHSKLNNELPHDKSNKTASVPSDDSDHPVHLRSLISHRGPHDETLGP